MKKRGGKRQGAGRPKAAPTKNITLRVPIIWIDETERIKHNQKNSNNEKNQNRIHDPD